MKSNRCTTNRRWLVTCAGNQMNQYEVTGTFDPQFCPGCGGPAQVREIPVQPPDHAALARAGVIHGDDARRLEEEMERNSRAAKGQERK
jgi:hypothetical protein